MVVVPTYVNDSSSRSFFVLDKDFLYSAFIREFCDGGGLVWSILRGCGPRDPSSKQIPSWKKGYEQINSADPCESSIRLVVSQKNSYWLCAKAEIGNENLGSRPINFNITNVSGGVR